MIELIVLVWIAGSIIIAVGLCRSAAKADDPLV